MAMLYISTRGKSPEIPFQDTVITGLAHDGGLFLPCQIPDVSSSLSSWNTLSYCELAFEVIRLYADLPDNDLKDLIERSYEGFRHPEITPLVSLDGLHILELFHGPTLAFKDLALQLLGNLFEYVLMRSNRQLNLLAATSGDTGSAAIYGVKGRKKMRIFVLYPHERISPTQERQMTTVVDDNVFCIAVKGSFDDCQNIVKEIFRDLTFRDQHSLGSVNSINWARILSQIVYYFYAAFRVMDRTGADRIRFSVPTGNFGDIFAGYMAAKMGLPVGLLVLASNENDILARFFNTGIYKRGHVHATINPSMDIQVASNLERYLYYKVGKNTEQVCQLMNQFAETGQFTLDNKEGSVDSLFAAGSSNTEESLEEIKCCYEKNGYLLDPHTAAGVHVARSFIQPDEPMICLATAHPAKFGHVIQKTLGKDIAHHEILDALKGLPARSTILPASTKSVRAFIEDAVKGTVKIK